MRILALSYRVRTLSTWLWFLIVVSFQLSLCLAQDAKEVARRALPSVVVVSTYDSAGRALGFGSGFFVTESVIVTNFHVIEGSSDADVKPVGDSKYYRTAGVVAFDKQRDLVLLKVDNLRRTPLTLSGAVQPQVGEDIYALGNPEGLEGTISPGIISALGTRKLEGEDLIQMTAPISSGSSGGPVVNRNAEVIGIASAFLSKGQNLNFAVPSRYLISILADMQAPRPLASVTAEGSKSTWVLMGGDSSSSLYYDADHVERASSGTFRVWSKLVPHDQATRAEFSVGVGDEPPLQASSYGYGITQDEYDCREHNSRMLSAADYDVNGKRLRFRVFSQATWEPIQPRTLGDAFLKKVCGVTAAGNDIDSLIGTYTGPWKSDSYNVSGYLALTINVVNGQVQALAVFTGSEYLNQDTLIVSFTPMGSGVWKMDYKGKKSKITGTGIFRGGRFDGDYRFSKLLWVDRGRWILQK